VLSPPSFSQCCGDRSSIDTINLWSCKRRLLQHAVLSSTAFARSPSSWLSSPFRIYPWVPLHQFKALLFFLLNPFLLRYL
jgi:8-oxo-dGTP pyrophosphatase MutT (NUDIX family)